MKSVRTRLVASREAHEAGDFAAGKFKGAEWARESAEFGQLERLRRNYDSCETATTSFYGLMGHPGDHRSPDEFLAEAIDGEGGDSREFWWRVMPSDESEPLESVAWLHGFAEGALEVFEASGL